MDSMGQGNRTIETPASTAAPFACAFGLALAFTAPVTHWFLYVVAFFVVLVGAISWWREVLPDEHRVAMAAEDGALPILPPSATPSLIDHLAPGQGGHRVRLPVEVPRITAGIKGGLAGGVVMSVAAMIYGYVKTGSPWFAANLFSASVLPEMANASHAARAEFNFTALMVATGIHFVFSVLVGLLYAAVLPMLPSRHPFLGSLLAPLFWTALTWPVVRLINPALAAVLDWPWFIACQLMFGLTAVWVVRRSEKVETLQTWPAADGETGSGETGSGEEGS